MYFLSWPHSSGSLSSIIGDRQSTVYLSRTLPLTSLYIFLPCIMMETASSIFSSLPSPSVICCPAPSVTTWNDGLWEAGRGITWGSHPTKRCPKGHPNWHLIQPDVGALRVEIHLCVLERVLLADAQRKRNSWKQKHTPRPESPVQKTEASFCHENHFCLKRQPEITAYLLGI